MMGDRQWPDPRGWEALTQAEAEQDARAGAVPSGTERYPDGRAALNYIAQHPDAMDIDDAIRDARDALAVAERERDEWKATAETWEDGTGAQLLIAERDDALRERDEAREALREIVRREAMSEYSSIYAAPGEFAEVARAALAGGPKS